MSGIMQVLMVSTSALGTTYRWIFDKSGAASFTVPAGVTSMTVEGVGPGADGTWPSGVGGGGGAYAKSIIAVTPGNTVYLNVGVPALSDSWLSKASNAAPSVSTDGIVAKRASGQTGGSSASCVGSTVFSGGNGGNGTGSPVACGGGGGAGGPAGAGTNGGNGQNTTVTTGGGGGAVGGASSTAGQSATTLKGGDGGDGPAGTGHGVGATATTDATVATVNTGAGGGGGYNPSHVSGQLGSALDLWGAGLGPGGGGGGSGTGSYGGAGTSGGGGGGGGNAGAGGVGPLAVTFTLPAASASYTLRIGPSTYTFNVAGVDGSGNVYTVAQLSNGSSVPVLTTKTDASGKIVWQRTLGSGSAHIYNIFATVDASFNVYITGYDYSASKSFLAKYNSSGVLQWQRTFLNATYIGIPQSIAIDSSGYIWVSGRDIGYVYGFMVKYNSTGAYQSAAYCGVPYPASNILSMTIATDPAGYIYSHVVAVSSTCCGCGVQTDYFYDYLFKYSNALAGQWGLATSDSGTNGGIGGPIGITVDGSSNVYWAHYTINSSYPVIEKLNSSGTRQWAVINTYTTYSSGVASDSRPLMAIDGSGNNYMSLTAYTYERQMWKINSSGATSFLKSMTMFGTSLSFASSGAFGNGTYYVGNTSVADQSIIAIPAAGLTAGNYGPYAVTDRTISTSAPTADNSVSVVTMTAFTATDAAGAFTDAAGTTTANVGWL